MVKKVSLVLCLVGLLSNYGQPSACADQWHWDVGLSYLSGFSDLVDLYENNLTSQGFTGVDTIEIPIGVLLRPFYQQDNGIRYDVGIGPAFFIFGDTDHFQLPLSTTLGYTFASQTPRSVYIRGGLSYHIVSGDYDDGSNIGFLGAVGIALARDNQRTLGIELAYDGAEVDINNKTTSTIDGIKISEIMITAYVRLR